MKFIVHYLARTPVKDLHFEIVSNDPVTAQTLDSLRDALAHDATRKTGRTHYEAFTAADIVIANIIPIPSGEPTLVAGS